MTVSTQLAAGRFPRHGREVTLVVACLSRAARRRVMRILRACGVPCLSLDPLDHEYPVRRTDQHLPQEIARFAQGDGSVRAVALAGLEELPRARSMLSGLPNPILLVNPDDGAEALSELRIMRGIGAADGLARLGDALLACSRMCADALWPVHGFPPFDPLRHPAEFVAALSASLDIELALSESFLPLLRTGRDEPFPWHVAASADDGRSDAEDRLPVHRGTAVNRRDGKTIFHGTVCDGEEHLIRFPIRSPAMANRVVLEREGEGEPLSVRLLMSFGGAHALRNSSVVELAAKRTAFEIVGLVPLTELAIGIADDSQRDAGMDEIGLIRLAPVADPPA